MKKITLILATSMCISTFAIAQAIPQKNAEYLLSTIKLTKGVYAGNDKPQLLSAYIDDTSGLQYMYVQQMFKGLKIYNAIKILIFSDSILKYTTDNFITDLTKKTTVATASIAPVTAVQKAAADLNLRENIMINEVKNDLAKYNKIYFFSPKLSLKNIETELIWLPNDERSIVTLAWNVSIDVLGSPDYWNVQVDANTGEVLSKNNYTVYENDEQNTNMAQDNNTNKAPVNNFAEGGTKSFLSPLIASASYNVIPFPYENRFVGGISVQTDSWTKAGAGNNATTYGWHFDGTTNYTSTRGNNVMAYDDSANINGPGRYVSAPSLSFNSTPNFNQQPTTVANREFAVTNLFYWNNILHDVYYQYGFTEAAANFQVNNISRGGVANDPIKAEAQDGSGTNNANFTTLPDGNSGRMQMYLYKSAANPITVISPASISNVYFSREGSFSTNNALKNIGPVSGTVVFYNDNASGTVHTGCVSPANNINGKIAFIISTSCSYIIKVKNAQDAGAIAVIVYRASGPSVSMGGTDNSITIPAVMISSTDAVKFLSVLNAGNTIDITLTTGIQFDGDLDNGIISHEFFHGVSNRLTGGGTNTTCLANAERGAEGWSDYSALMITTNWATASLTDGSLARGEASYVTDQVAGGIGTRTVPYSTNKTIDPHTYTDVANTSFAGEVHYIGEVWCSALWDMTWNIIQQVGTINPDMYKPANGGGNTIALKLVMEGLKLQVCSPGFLDARNAIIAADSLLYNGAYKCAIWKAFAGRGMGKSALQGSSASTTDQTAAFDIDNATATLNTLGNTVFCSGDSVILFTNSALLYTWFRNNVQVSSSVTDNFYIAKSPGTYKVTATSTAGCTSTSSTVDVTVNAKPYIGEDTTVYVVCAGEKANISGIYNTTGLVSHWGIADSTKAPMGTYKLIATNSFGCKDTAAVIVAQDVSIWLGNDGSDWHTPTNWSTNKVPGDSTHVIINNSSASDCIISTADATAASVQVIDGATYQIINNKKLVVKGGCAVLPVP